MYEFTFLQLDGVGNNIEYFPVCFVYKWIPKIIRNMNSGLLFIILVSENAEPKATQKVSFPWEMTGPR